MLKSDYDEIIKKITDADTIADGVMELTEQLRKDEAEYKELVASNDNLRKANGNMLMRLTDIADRDAKDAVKPEPTPEEARQEFFDKYFTDRKFV